MKNLIEKYFEGQTSLEEEARLKAYFQSDDIDESLKAYQPFFRYLEQEAAPSMREDFDDRLMEMLDESTPVVPMQRNVRFMRIVRAVAAVGAILLTAYFVLQNNEPVPSDQVQIDWSKYEITDEKLALEETEKALMLLSEKLNKGKNKTAEEIAKTEAVTHYLN